MSHRNSRSFHFVITRQEEMVIVVLSGSLFSCHSEALQACRAACLRAIREQPCRFVLICCRDVVEISDEMTDLVASALEEIRMTGSILKVSSVSEQLRLKLATSGLLRSSELVESMGQVLLRIAPVVTGVSRPTRLRAA